MALKQIEREEKYGDTLTKKPEDDSKDKKCVAIIFTFCRSNLRSFVKSWMGGIVSSIITFTAIGCISLPS